MASIAVTLSFPISAASENGSSPKLCCKLQTVCYAAWRLGKPPLVHLLRSPLHSGFRLGLCFDLGHDCDCLLKPSTVRGNDRLENIGKYHFFRQLWLVLGVKLMEINSNLFSRLTQLTSLSTLSLSQLYQFSSMALAPPLASVSVAIDLATSTACPKHALHHHHELLNYTSTNSLAFVAVAILFPISAASQENEPRCQQMTPLQPYNKDAKAGT